jgi:peptide/nickel transport system substrate-binding protein
MPTPSRPGRARRPLAVTSLAAVAALVLTGCLSSDR